MVYYKYELRWTSSDNTLREPDASGSFFIEPRPFVSVIFRRSELKKIPHTADNLSKQIHIVVMYPFFTTFLFLIETGNGFSIYVQGSDTL